MVPLLALLAAAPLAVPGPVVRVFVGARVIDGTGAAPIEDAVFVVSEGRIQAIGPRGQVKLPEATYLFDLAGKTVIPGLINTHGHVDETVGLGPWPEVARFNLLDQLERYARYGVTTVFSLGGDGPQGFRLRDAGAHGTIGRARLHVSGPVITAPSPEEARARVDELAARKPDFVKIRVDDNLGAAPKMPPPIYRAVIDQARKHGLRVAAHVFYLDDAKGLLEAGVDFIAHSIRDRDVDGEVIRLFKQRDVCLSPTLMREVSTFVYESEPVFFSDPSFLREADAAVLAELREPKRRQSVRESRSAQAYKAALEVASRNLKKLADAGVRIAMGTDTGPPGRFQGYFEHLELERMVGAGLTPRQALLSATGEAARCMGLEGQVGTLRPGAWADFVVLSGDPLEDVRRTRAIESVWVGGDAVRRK